MMIQTFHHSEFADLAAMKRLKGCQTVSVCIPTLNEEDTIGEIIRVLIEGLDGFADEVVVIDSGSEDRTLEVAKAAGASTYHAADILPELPPAAGKGENIWKSLQVLKGDIACFLDGDVRNMHARFVLGIVGPLLANSKFQYVKGYYDRAGAAVEVGQRPVGGGRVTEALIRPLFALFYPELAGFIQPLAGEYAARRALLEELWMPTGYGVETAHLIDVFEKHGPGVFAQTDLEERIHRHQETGALGRMSFSILHAFFRRATETGKLSLGKELPSMYQHFLRIDGVCQSKAWQLPDLERPPARTIESGTAGDSSSGT